MFSSLINSAKEAVSGLTTDEAQQPNNSPNAPQSNQQSQTKVTEEKPKEGGDFFSGLMNVAQEVGKAIGEKSSEGAETVKSGAGAAAESTKNTAEGAAQMTKEDLEKLKEGLGSLVGKATEAYQQYTQKTEPDVEEKMSVIDSQGGKVQISSVVEKKTEVVPEKAEEKSGDFLSGLMNVAQEVGKVIGEKTSEGAQTVKSGAESAVDSTKKTTEGAAQMTKEDLQKITEGLGSLVGQAKAAYHQYADKEGEKEKEERAEKKTDTPTEDFTASKPVVDDIEGEIGKVVTGGYTAEKSKPEKTGLIASVGQGVSKAFEKTTQLTQSGAELLKETGKSALDSTLVAGQTVVGHTKEGLSTAGEKTKEGAEWVVEGARSAGSTAVGTGQTVVEKTKEGLSTAGEKTKEGAEWVVEGARSAGCLTFGAAMKAFDKISRQGEVEKQTDDQKKVTNYEVDVELKSGETKAETSTVAIDEKM